MLTVNIIPIIPFSIVGLLSLFVDISSCAESNDLSDIDSTKSKSIIGFSKPFLSKLSGDASLAVTIIAFDLLIPKKPNKMGISTSDTALGSDLYAISTFLISIL
jgi:hypothetical protein